MKIVNKIPRGNITFSDVKKLYKTFFDKRELINTRNFHKYAFQDDIFFKAFYLNKKFIGFSKGFYGDNFLYVSWLAYKKENYLDILIKEIVKLNKNSTIIFVLRDLTKIEIYNKLGFHLVETSDQFKIGTYYLVSSKPTEFNEEKLVKGIKKSDWPMMFKNSNFNEIYYANVEYLDENRSSVYLPEIRKDKVNKLKFSKDKKLSIGVYLLLKEALKKHHVDISNYDFYYDEKGKPFLKDCPYQFSLSHSGKYVLVGLSKKAIGVDIQEMKELQQDISSLVFTKRDQQYYDSSNNKLDAFYKIWTYKEAIVKKSGEGISKMKEANINYLFDYGGSFLYSLDIIDNYKIGIATTTYGIKNIMEVVLK